MYNNQKPKPHDKIFTYSQEIQIKDLFNNNNKLNLLASLAKSLNMRMREKEDKTT